MREKPRQMTVEHAHAAGERFITGEPSLEATWRQVAYAWIDTHEPASPADEDEDQLTARHEAIADAYLDGIRANLLEALGDTAQGRPEPDTVELAATLHGAAEQLDESATTMTFMVDTLRALLDEATPHGLSTTARLAAEGCIRVGLQTARELNAAIENLSLEADRYGH